MSNFLGKLITAGKSGNNDWILCGLTEDLYAVSGYCLGVVV